MRFLRGVVAGPVFGTCTEEVVIAGLIMVSMIGITVLAGGAGKGEG